MSGYSGTPLFRKLGIKSGARLYIKNAPDDYLQLIEPLPEGVKILNRLSSDISIIHLFTNNKNELTTYIHKFMTKVEPRVVIWISWPKKTSKMASEISLNSIRDIAHPFGLVDTKVCAINATWSGLKLVLRRRV